MLPAVVGGLVCIHACIASCWGNDEGVAFLLTELESGSCFVPAESPTTESATNQSITDPAVNRASYFGESRGMGTAFEIDGTRVGYDRGFVIASSQQQNLRTETLPFLLRINGWGQLRYTNFNSHGPNPNVNQFQLKRGRLIFSGHAFTPDFAYYVQLDGRSSSGDDVRLLDYYLAYDVGHDSLGLRRNALAFKTGRYKMPLTMARYLSGASLNSPIGLLLALSSM